MDDETYCACDPTQVPGNEFYNVVDGNEVDRESMLKRKEKFYKKFLVWQAIAETGEVSEPYITIGTINKEIYLEECIKQRLVPFINDMRKKYNVLFWPDLASSHYANCVTDYLKNENIQFVQKDDNPPNVPNLRPIERFWALCKKKYKSLNKICDTKIKFRNSWVKISNEIAEKSGKNLFRNFRKNLYQAGHKSGRFL